MVRSPFFGILTMSYLFQSDSISCSSMILLNNTVRLGAVGATLSFNSSALMLYIPGLFPFFIFRIVLLTSSSLIGDVSISMSVLAWSVHPSGSSAASVGTLSTSLKFSCHLSIIFPFSMSSLPSFDLMPLVLLLFPAKLF